MRVVQQLLTTQNTPATEMQKKIEAAKKRKLRNVKRGRGHIRTDVRTKCNITHTEEHNSDRYINLGVGDRIKAL